jgi:ABC-type glycerol-3-phosphate transport system permease component
MDTTYALAGDRQRPAGRSATARRVRRQWAVTLIAGAVIVVLTYFPILFVVSNSLRTGQNISTNGVFDLFTQFDYSNYITAWDGVAGQLLNTVIVAAAAIAIGVTAAALGAYAFSQLKFRGKSVLFMA